MATTKIPAEFLSINAISGTLIADNAITTVHIAQNAITSVQIPNNSIGTVQIALNTVTSTHIAENNITTIQLANNSVQTLNIADDQVTADKLASAAVVTASIVDLNVTTAKIAANAITASKIPDGSITATQIGANAVTLAKMASLARGSILIGNSAADVTALTIGSNGTVLKSDGTDIAWAADTDTTLTSEQVQDIAGAMFSSNTETGIAATYQDGDGTIDLVIGANVIVAGMIAQNSILTRHIDDDQVTGAQLADNIDIAGTLDVTGATVLDSNLTVDTGLTLLKSTGGSAELPLKVTDVSNNMVFQVQGGGGAHFNYGPVGVGTTSPTTQFTVATSANITQTSLTSASTVAWDAKAKANAMLVPGANLTIGSPSNSIEGAVISIEIAMNGTPRTIAWNTVFEFAASTAPTATATANKTDIFTFRYNGSVWQEIGRVQNMAQT